MYYEFYIDVFFVVNLAADFFLLCCTSRLLKGTAIPLKLLAGAFFGAGAGCLFVLCAGDAGEVKTAIFCSVTVLFMVRIGCGAKTGKEMLMGMLVFLGATFFMGGFFAAVGEISRKGIFLFCVIASAAYGVMNTGIKLFKYLKGKETLQCEVTVALEGKEMKIKGLYDTGNCLVEKKTGKAVCVMEYECFARLLDEGQRRVLENFCAAREMAADTKSREVIDMLKPRFILYTSVGCERSLLPVVTAKSLTISSGGRKKRVTDAPIGLSKTPLSHDGKFQIIISPAILDS